MPKREWFRMSEWSSTTEAEFERRLARARPASRAQYLRLQAFHLAEAGHHRAALALLDRCLALNNRVHMAAAYLQRGQSELGVGNHSAALTSFRLCLEFERGLPNVRTSCWIEFPWYIVNAQRRDLYDEALAAIASNAAPSWPVERFRAETVRAFIADDRGDRDAARMFAEHALREAAMSSSGFRNHPELGVVGDRYAAAQARLRQLVDPNT